MEDLEDELDLRYHKGLNPDVYYRCPTLESLDGALRNELEKNASSLIPIEVVTEFVFAAASLITISVPQQPNLDALIQPQDFLQSITVEHALCRNIDGKDRLKAQRAVARSIIAAIQTVDGFKYSERSAANKEGGDGARLKYVCQDSVQGQRREKKQDSEDSEYEPKKGGNAAPPIYDCGGAVHVKFSIKREAINVVYKHNPIHGESQLHSLPDAEVALAPHSQSTNGTNGCKTKRSKKDRVPIEDGYVDPDLDMSTSPEAPKSAKTKKRKKSAAETAQESTRKPPSKKGEKVKEPPSSSASRTKSQITEPPPPPKPAKGKACIRCREKKIKCNEAKPTCNQCRRGLWTCQYELPAPTKRSKTGCINCKNRKRKCTEERPSCAYCLRIDDDCAYAGPA